MPPQDDLLLNYAPGELCVVVGHDPRAAAGRALYERVGACVSRSIGELLKGRRAVLQGDAFYQDLAPNVLMESFAANERRALLRQLDGEGGRLEQREPRPFTVLPHERGATMLGMYQVGRDRPDLAKVHVARHVDSVRELTHLVNQNLGKINADLQSAAEGVPGARVRAVTPNWLTVAAYHGCGSPGARPEAVSERGNWRFEFLQPGPTRRADATSHPQQSRLQDLVDRARRAADTPSGVVVAILDTCPQPAQVQAQANAHPENRLLQDVRANVALESAGSLGSGHFDFLKEFRPNWHEDLLVPRPDQDYLMPDHGLFSAGIIRDIAPSAEVHLIRVLSDYGVGDLLSITAALSELPARFLGGTAGREGRSLVVNLSLGADLPVGERLVERWLPRTAGDPAALRLHQADAHRSFDAMHASLRAVVSWLDSLGVLVVAAAGNDSLDAPRKEPRYPARYDSVLGVGAVRNANVRDPSSFSNRGDALVLGNGVAVFGGNATRQAAGSPPRIDLTARPVDAVVGVVSADTLPLGAGANRTGWAYWAGTSFSTPIVSAIAADLWASQDPAARMRPDALIPELIDRFSVPIGSANDPDGPLDCPAIFARQVRVP